MLLLHHSLGGDEPSLLCPFCIEKQPLNRKITNEELQKWNQLS